MNDFDSYYEPVLDEPKTASTKKPLTVSELTRQIKSALEGRFSYVCVEGEISSFKLHGPSGHMYFNLKDSNAVIKAAFFSRANAGLKFRMEDGLQILCYGRVSIYDVRGEYQIIVERAEPKGLGALQLAFEQLKAKLEKEGLFETGRKRAIPAYPRKIGVVTSPTGAAIRDILNVLNRRFSGLEILVNPCNVQGESAAGEIARAIDELNRMDDIDVMIVGRGGGSLEDLWSFNEEIVARAIFRSRIPVISAVGHEIDWTIADFVADLRAPTPSAAAELVCGSRIELESRIGELSARVSNAMKNVLEGKREFLGSLSSSYAFRQPFTLVEKWQQRVDELSRQLSDYAKNCLSMKNHCFKNLVGKLEALSPVNILSRGYSLTFDTKGTLLRSAESVKEGDIIRTHLDKGVLESKVTRKESKP